MSLTARELNQLKKVAAIANQLIAKAEANLAAVALKAAEPAKKTAKSVKADMKAAKHPAPKAVKKAAKEVAPKAVAKAAKKPAKVAKVAKAAAPKASANQGKRTRRTGDELVAFRQMLANERKNGVSVAELSKQHGISAAYIYQL